jgi:hypothetical protein
VFFTNGVPHQPGGKFDHTGAQRNPVLLHQQQPMFWRQRRDHHGPRRTRPIRIFPMSVPHQPQEIAFGQDLGSGKFFHQSSSFFTTTDILFLLSVKRLNIDLSPRLVESARATKSRRHKDLSAGA